MSDAGCIATGENGAIPDEVRAGDGGDDVDDELLLMLILLLFVTGRVGELAGGRAGTADEEAEVEASLLFTVAVVLLTSRPGLVLLR